MRIVRGVIEQAERRADLGTDLVWRPEVSGPHERRVVEAFNRLSSLERKDEAMLWWVTRLFSMTLDGAYRQEAEEVGTGNPS